jgi:hypothetical protein
LRSVSCSLAAGDVVHPHFARHERAPGGEVLACHDVLVVNPDAVVEQAEFFLGDLFGVRAVGVHRPAVVAAAGIGGEEDFFAVGREAGLYFPGDALA